jgi:hypothetical protein
MRLPDTFYSKVPLDGYYEPPGQQAPVQFYKGENIVFDIYLNYENKPVTNEDWDIEAIVKSSVYANDVIWNGKTLTGIFEHPDHVKGYYHIIIEADKTCNWLIGTYWMDIIIHQKSNNTVDIKDKHAIIVRQPFSFDYSAASTGIVITKNNIQERTVPYPTDITKI